MILRVFVKALLRQQKRNGAGGERRDEGTRGRLWQLGGGGAAWPVQRPVRPPRNLPSCAAEAAEDQLPAQVLEQIRFHQLCASWTLEWSQLARLVMTIGFL